MQTIRSEWNHFLHLTENSITSQIPKFLLISQKFLHVSRRKSLTKCTKQKVDSTKWKVYTFATSSTVAQAAFAERWRQRSISARLWQINTKYAKRITMNTSSPLSCVKSPVIIEWTYRSLTADYVNTRREAK